MSVDPDYFDAMYAASADPWGFRTRWYERRKRAITVASLPRERYDRAFEPGCSVGVLTRELAGRCDSLLAWESAAAAVEGARSGLADLAGVRVEQGRVPTDWPRGDFDLIVLSELLYYFSDAELAEVITRSAASLRPEGTLLAVHWRHPVAEHVRSGDEVHAALAALPGLACTAGHTEADFRLDVFAPAGSGAAPSVAQNDGLV